jgi:hypothetical membrane protein
VTRTAPFSSTHPALHALLAAIGPVIFLVCEAISAIAWEAGTYDYGHNFISDLGTTICGSSSGGRELCSPLHGVMNFGFVAMGLAIGASALLLAARLTRRRRIAVIALGITIPVGMILVATIHGQDESVANGTMWLHGLGALLAIAAGNSLGLVVGPAGRSLGFPRWYRPTALVLGIVGLVALVFIAVEPPPFDPAVYERISVYTIFAWHFVTAFCLLRSRRRAPSPLLSR